MSWLADTYLRDLDDSSLIEATCLQCAHTWLQSPAQLLLKAEHRNVRLNEVARGIVCTRFGCHALGARITVLRNEETSGFVGGMP